VPGLYSGLIPFHFAVPGALTVATTAKRLVVPFAYEIEGVSASVNTSPAGSALILDLLAGPNGTAPGSLASVFAVDTTKRPQIAAGAFDNTPVSGPDQPAVTGDRATEPSYTQYLARPTAPATTTFAGNQPVNMQPNQPQSVQVNPTEPGSANQPNEAPNVRWSGNAGDALQLAVVQVGSGTAGSDLSVIVWVVEK
jgi:hypothetical protein